MRDIRQSMLNEYNKIQTLNVGLENYDVLVT